MVVTQEQKTYYVSSMLHLHHGFRKWNLQLLSTKQIT